jgi:hypothetical protein
MLDLRGRNWLKPLREHLGATAFIETGTYEGGGIAAAIASGFNDRIWSCDIDEGMVTRAREAFASHVNVGRLQVVHGPSTKLFQRLMSYDFRNKPPVVFWLDAHWFPGLGPKPAGYVCPLADELVAVHDFYQRCGVRPCVLIDDVCAFNDPELEFPSLGGVLGVLREIVGTAADIRILDSHLPRNVIAAIPPKE